jgi:hypothetical protein
MPRVGIVATAVWSEGAPDRCALFGRDRRACALARSASSGRSVPRLAYQIPGNNPQSTAFCRFTFNVVGSDQEPRGKPNLRSHNRRSFKSYCPFSG